MQDNDRNLPSPLFSVLGTVNSPTGFNPPATVPTLLRNACWPVASKAAFDYMVDPQRIINTLDASTCSGGSGGDGGVLYYFGHDKENAIKIGSEDTESVSAYIFLEVPTPADATDSDEDGLLDEWETSKGIDFDADGKFDVTLPTTLDPYRKDILIYYDWTLKPDNTSNKPRQKSLDLVVDALKNAPVPNTKADGTAGLPGITLHFQEGKQVEDGVDDLLGEVTGSDYSWREFADIKAKSFPEEMWPAYHYVIFGTKHQPSGSSGMSRVISDSVAAGASDFIVTIGSWDIKSLDKLIPIESGTIMHELGHNLALGHGGTTDMKKALNENFKPNYLSIMNYSFQMTGVLKSDGKAVLDYSRFGSDDIRTLDESAIDEQLWLAVQAAPVPPSSETTAKNPDLSDYKTRKYCYKPSGTGANTTPAGSTPPTLSSIWDENYEISEVSLTESIDWNCNGKTDTSDVTANVNAGWGRELSSYNDWDRLVFNGGAIGALGAALNLPLTTDTRLHPEPTFKDYEALLDSIYVDDSQSSLLIPNGNFEYPTGQVIDGATRLDRGDSTTLPGWTVVTGNVDLVESDNPSAFGGRFVDLNGTQAGAIGHRVQTTVGTRYELRFVMAGVASTVPAVKELSVEVDGSSSHVFDVANSEPGDRRWEYRTLKFVATKPSTTITFRSLIDGADGPALDYVSLRAVANDNQVPDDDDDIDASSIGDVPVSDGCVADIRTANDLSAAISSANSGKGCPSIRLNEDIPLGQLIPPHANQHGDNAFPIITTAVVIDGNDHIISRVNADSYFRFFFVNARGEEASLTLTNITLSGGQTGGDETAGGAIFVDAGNGGHASLTISRGTFSQNAASGRGGAIMVLGSNGGSVVVDINDSEFAGNSGSEGGALFINGTGGGHVVTTIKDSLLSNNTARADAGAIYLDGSDGLTTMRSDGNRFRENSDHFGSYAIYNNGRGKGKADIELIRTTFSHSRLDNLITSEGNAKIIGDINIVEE